MLVKLIFTLRYFQGQVIRGERTKKPMSQFSDYDSCLNSLWAMKQKIGEKIDAVTITRRLTVRYWIDKSDVTDIEIRKTEVMIWKRKTVSLFIADYKGSKVINVF